MDVYLKCELKVRILMSFGGTYKERKNKDTIT
jgi:hypothetical protein